MVGIGYTEGKGDGCVDVGHEEAELRGCISDVTEAASDGLHVEDEPGVLGCMSFVGELVDGASNILDGSAYS